MPAPIAVQMYSLREEVAVDMRAVLRRLGEAGFVGVELAGYGGLSPQEVAAALDEYGLLAASAHFAGDLSADGVNTALDGIQAVGATNAVVAAIWPQEFADLDGIARSAEALNQAAEIGRSRGVAIGYHNHFWEFETTIDGVAAWWHLVDRLEPEVFAELDIYWATVGGADAADVAARLDDRARLLHVKDGAVEPKTPMVAVGSGSIDVPRILGAAPSAQWHIVELDACDTDMMTAVIESKDYLVGNGLSSGRP